MSAYLTQYPDVADQLVVLRLVGKTDLTQSTADTLVAEGVFDLDDNGYHLSDAAEDFIDMYIQTLDEELKQKILGLQQQASVGEDA